MPPKPSPSQSQPQPFKWTLALERAFLLSIIVKANITVSTRFCEDLVNGLGGGTTGNALRQRFDKMKKESGVTASDSGAGAGAGGAEKGKVDDDGGKKEGGKKRKARTAEKDGDAAGEENPMKRLKAEREDSLELI